MNRYIIGVLAFLGLTILLIVLLFTGGGSHKTAPAVTPIYEYANTPAVVKLVVGGPIVAPQDHNSAEFEISQYSASFRLYQGYNGHVIASKTYNNTENSFKTFLYALYYAGYDEGTTNSSYSSDIGLCSTGDRYDLYLTEYGQTITHYWITNCSGVPKTFDGDFALTLSLINDQIPDLSQLSAGANI